MYITAKANITFEAETEGVTWLCICADLDADFYNADYTLVCNIINGKPKRKNSLLISEVDKRIGYLYSSKNSLPFSFMEAGNPLLL